mmetsp:Transcript_78228/g.155454  ORF Transcript_78228/g.155454 Transcript_78228/m.155454 type:complete len:271 (-) Transcript_78228:997-1809(-)
MVLRISDLEPAHGDIQVQRELERVDLLLLVRAQIDELCAVAEGLIVACTCSAELGHVDSSFEELCALFLVLLHHPQPIWELELPLVVVLILAVGCALGGSGGGGDLQSLLLCQLICLHGRCIGAGGRGDLLLYLLELSLQHIDSRRLRLVRINPLFSSVQQWVELRCVNLLAVLARREITRVEHVTLELVAHRAFCCCGRILCCKGLLLLDEGLESIGSEQTSGRRHGTLARRGGSLDGPTSDDGRPESNGGVIELGAWLLRCNSLTSCC